MKLKAFAGTATLAAFAFVLTTSAPAAAKGGPKGPKPKASTQVKPASVAPKGGAKGGPKGGSQASFGAAKAPKGATKAPKGAAQAPKNTGSAAHAPKSTGGKKSASSATNPAGFGSGPGPGFELNKAQRLLTQNTSLHDKMQTRLGGADPIAAASEFRNLGQFVAAVNASHNQGYNFAELKALMTGPNALSLGQAKKQLRAGGGTSPLPPTSPGPAPGFGNTPPAPGSPALPPTSGGPAPGFGNTPAPGSPALPPTSAGAVPAPGSPALPPTSAGAVPTLGTSSTSKSKSKTKTRQ